VTILPRKHRTLVMTLLLTLLWEAAYRAGLLNPIIFGSPILVVQAAMKDGDNFLRAFQVTAFEMVVAVAIAWIAGVLLGIVIGISRFAAILIAPLLSAMIALPLIVLYPAFVAGLGIGPISKIAYGTLNGVFPVMLATMLGVSTVDKQYLVMATAMGASRVQLVTQVIARMAVPTIVSGLRVGMSLAIIGVITSEMLASVDGVGFWISYHRTLFNVGHVYLGIIQMLLVAIAANWILKQLEDRLGRWKQGVQTGK